MILCQLFSSITGQTIPEDVFETTMYWLLQGDRKNRSVITRSIMQISRTTPHQLEIVGWPREYIGEHTQKGVAKIYSLLISRKFKSKFHSCVQNGDCLPCHRYVKIWDDPCMKARVILYFQSETEKTLTKRLITSFGNRVDQYQGKTLKYTLEARDVSHMSSCYFCRKFLPCLSERLHINDKDSEVFNDMRHSFGSLSSNQDWNFKLSQIPICTECQDSKENQCKYRKYMFDPRNTYTQPLSLEERYEHISEQSVGMEKPDMTNIPHYTDYGFKKTPLDFPGSYLHLLDKYSLFYWHPDMTADEYMRKQQYESIQYLKNADPLDDDFSR